MRRIAFLRGINVNGRNKIPMADLESLCAGIQWQSVRTHLQTGNVMFSAEGTREWLEKCLEKVIESHFGFTVPVIVRDLEDLTIILDDSPFSKEASRVPSQILLYLTKCAIQEGAFEYLKERSNGEEVSVGEASMWIYFPNGVGASKLTPAVIDRAVGSTATGRNWNTVTKIQSICTQ